MMGRRQLDMRHCNNAKLGAVIAVQNANILTSIIGGRNFVKTHNHIHTSSIYTLCILPYADLTDQKPAYHILFTILLIIQQNLQKSSAVTVNLSILMNCCSMQYYSGGCVLLTQIHIHTLLT